IVGDEDTVAAQLAELATSGVTDFVAGEFSTGADGVRTRTFLKSLLQVLGPRGLD
ncbi:MAG: class F420-dependent oxidoreductase, partial [Actinomycetia bacterium]|nr:class F420-dependent oxidoreductase [Actinomycetes bacterium]